MEFINYFFFRVSSASQVSVLCDMKIQNVLLFWAFLLFVISLLREEKKME